MNRFNDSLVGSVVVGIDDCWSENNGHYRKAIIWNGEEVSEQVYFSGNHKYNIDDAVVNASDEQVKEAGEWFVKNNAKSFRSRNSGQETYLNCVVELKGSRKARNRVPMLVTNFEDGYYSNRFNNKVSSKIFVWDIELDEGTWVGTSCVNKVLECEKPSWYEKVLKK